MDSTRNLAARAGRWSAHHRKKAIFGWLAFVIVAVFIGGSVGTQTLDGDDFGIGESGRADKAIGDHFPEKGSESVLIQSRDGIRNTDPEFRTTVTDVVRMLRCFERFFTQASTRRPNANRASCCGCGATDIESSRRS